MAAKHLVAWLMMAMALLLVALQAEADGTALCNIDTTKLNLCRAAVTGYPPAPPTKQCCKVVKHASLPCLCSYKSVLPAFGINPKYAFALPAKCGLKTPPECLA